MVRVCEVAGVEEADGGAILFALDLFFLETMAAHLSEFRQQVEGEMIEREV